MQEMTTRHMMVDRLRRYQSLRFAFRVLRECRAAYHLSRNKLSHAMRGEFGTGRNLEYLQSIPVFDMSLEGFRDADEFCRRLDQAGIRHDHGAHAVYLPPQQNLKSVLGEIVDWYPPDTGFKILRSFAPPSRASYIWNADVRPVTRAMMGAVENQALAANALHCLGIGPACYGVVHLRAGDADLTAFVIRHVDGETPAEEDSREFLDRLNRFVHQGLLEIVPQGTIEDLDFRIPHCNGNLLRERSTGKLHYVDFQRFLPRRRQLLESVADESKATLHFGGTSTLFRGGKKYLYQSIPGLGGSGKRDTVYRWGRFQAVLEEHGVSCRDRVVLDVCCNSGMMLAQALKSGARWGLGWDLPEVVGRSEKVMSVLGASRVSLVPASLSPDYALADSIPEWVRPKLNGAVVLYLAAVQHVGVIRDLAKVPWEALLFEGHQGECGRQTDDHLAEMEATWNCRIAFRATLSDGDCGKRDFALLKRNQSASL